MRYVRFRDPTGEIRTGTWKTKDAATVTAYPADGERLSVDTEELSIGEIDVLPPCRPSKIVCVGLNYADHAAEQDSEIPDRPLLFLKGPNAIAGHGDTLELPSGKERIDYEAELGVVIGERCRDVTADDAETVIAGYTCVNDVSNRDDQQIETNWVRGKAFDDSAPIGPVIATPDEVPPDAAVRCRHNGELVQDSDRSKFIFDIPTLIEEITTYMTLEPGDVISTGTPEGVGPLADSDTVEVEVEGVGTLSNVVRIP
ncbi:MAG: fumarylacetoacetate hydrolase family protein [Natronomonas sp.]